MTYCDNAKRGKNMKKWLAFFPAFLLLLGSCSGSGGNANTSSQASSTPAPTSVEPPVVKHNVRFLIGDDVYETKQVVHGEKASFPETLPTKAGDATANRYGFAGWDNLLAEPITQDLDVHGSFEAYSDDPQLLDDFESYSSIGKAKDAGWFAGKQENSQWVEAASPIAISLSKNAPQGKQALRFDTARNMMDYGIVKKFDETNRPAAKYANGLHFRVMFPSEEYDIDLARVVMHFDIETAEETLHVTLKHDIPKVSSDYIDYTIPFYEPNWMLWDTEPIDVYEKAAGYQIDAGKIPTMLNDMVFFFKYKNKAVSTDPSYPAVFIDDISFITVDPTEDVETVDEDGKFYNRYTGKTATNNTVRLDITDASHATATVLDSNPQQVIAGTYTVDAGGIKFTSDTAGLLTYEASFKNSASKLVCKKVEGALKDAIGNMDLDAVQVVENFESYSSDGVAYHQGNYQDENVEETLSGLRGSLFYEYYDTSETYKDYTWGGKGWSLMGGSGSQVYLKSDSPAHSGDKFMAIKGNGNNAFRYMNWDIYKGTADTKAYRGTTMSFWAKAKAGTVVKDFTVYAVSKSNLKNGEQDIPNYARSYHFSGANLQTDAWKQFTIELNPKCVYYGFMIKLEKNGVGEQWMHIDDIEIYTANPYAEYQEPVTGVSLDKDTLDLNKGESETLIATVAPEEAYNKNVSWSSGDPTIASVNNSGKVTAVGKGSTTITVTTEDGGFTDTCTVNVTAPLKTYPEGTYTATINMGGADHQLVIALGNEANGLVSVIIDSGLDTVATDVNWTAATKALSITTTGEYSSMSFGHITAVFDAENDKLTNIGFDGSISAVIANNGTYQATNLPMWNCDGTTADLQALFKRRYDSGSGWQTDSGNTDRFESNTTQFVSGTGSVRRRGFSGGKVAMAFNADFDPAKTVSHISFWVYNPTASDVEMRMWRYTSASLGGASEVAPTNLPKAIAGQWTYVERSFTSGAIYNFQIADFTKSGAKLSFDNIVLF